MGPVAGGKIDWTVSLASGSQAYACHQRRACVTVRVSEEKKLRHSALVVSVNRDQPRGVDFKFYSLSFRTSF
jgi:hypothetical protein